MYAEARVSKFTHSCRQYPQVTTLDARMTLAQTHDENEHSRASSLSREKPGYFSVCIETGAHKLSFLLSDRASPSFFQNRRQLTLNITTLPILLPRLPTQLSQPHRAAPAVQTNGHRSPRPENLTIQSRIELPRVRILDHAGQMQLLTDQRGDFTPRRLVFAGALAEVVRIVEELLRRGRFHVVEQDDIRSGEVVDVDAGFHGSALADVHGVAVLDGEACQGRDLDGETVVFWVDCTSSAFQHHCNMSYGCLHPWISGGITMAILAFAPSSSWAFLMARSIGRCGALSGTESISDLTLSW